MSTPSKDPLMKVHILSSTVEPQKLIWLAAHQCITNEVAIECPLSEATAGVAVVSHLLAGNRGHYSPLEQPSISLSLSYVPHDCMQQLARHRMLSFSVQSFRYSSPSSDDLERAVYLRQPGTYNSQGGSYVYTAEQRALDSLRASLLIADYTKALESGVAPEHARGLLPFNLRQHLVVGGNLRAWLHVLDLRLKADAQPEIQQLCAQIATALECWCPQILEWYNSNRSGKARLSP